MKRIVVKTVVFLLFMSVNFSCAERHGEDEGKFVIDVAQVTTRSGQNLAWDYPVKPGSQEWAALRSGKEKVDICQIPSGLLNTLNTKDLAIICMNYPLSFTYAFFDDERYGVHLIVEQFNGFTELSKRKDGVWELIKIYQEFPVFAERPPRSSTDYDAPYKLPFLELLLADNTFLKQIDDQMAIELGEIIVDKYSAKVKNMHIYSLWNIKKTFLLGAVLMNHRNMFPESSVQQFVINRFIDEYRYPEPTLFSEMSQIISGL